MGDTVKAVLGILAAILLVVVIGVAGWQFEWWLAEKNVDRKVQIENRNTGTQTAWRDRVHELMSEVALLPHDTPARQALIHEACEKAGRLTGPYYDDQIEVFAVEHCT